MLVVIVVLYRLVAITIILIPMVQNIINQGEIVDSLLYMPLLTLALTLLFIVVDKKLKQSLINNTKLTTSRAHIKEVKHQKLAAMWHKLCKYSA